MAISNISGNPTVVAELSLSEVCIGDYIWINGVVGVDNDDLDQFASLDFKIFKGDVLINGSEIYLATEELDKENDGDAVNVPISHVDVIKNCVQAVKYVLTVQKTGKAKNTGKEQGAPALSSNKIPNGDYL